MLPAIRAVTTTATEPSSQATRRDRLRAGDGGYPAGCQEGPPGTGQPTPGGADHDDDPGGGDHDDDPGGGGHEEGGCGPGVPGAPGVGTGGVLSGGGHPAAAPGAGLLGSGGANCSSAMVRSFARRRKAVTDALAPEQPAIAAQHYRRTSMTPGNLRAQLNARH
jgi:hypothetical protein